MKLKEFIKELEKITHQVNDPNEIEVEMADCIPVVKPILRKKTVYITDVDPDSKED